MNVLVCHEFYPEEFNRLHSELMARHLYPSYWATRGPEKLSYRYGVVTYTVPDSAC